MNLFLAALGSPHLLLLILALIFCVCSMIPPLNGYPLLAVAVLLTIVVLLIGA